MTQPPVNTEQMPLAVDYRATIEAAGLKLLQVVAEAVGASGKQGDDFAADLGVDPGQLSRALAGRGTHFAVKWLPAVVWRDRSRILIRHLCALAGGTFVEVPKLTPEQRLEMLEKTLRESGPFGEAVLKAAYGEERP